jgi:Cu-Zn family superoxide dismutase
MRGLSWNDQYRTVCSDSGCSDSGPRTQPVTVRRRMRRRLALALVVGAAAFIPMACAYNGLSLPAVTAITLHGEDTLTTPTPTSKANTYNPALAPVGARLATTMTPSGESTNAVLTVSGLLPNRGYAVHAHTNACGPDPALAGPHYQNRIDPAATPENPSTDPQYANPRNEIWLDVRTDAAGSGTSRTTVPFVFTDRGPGSIVVHEAMHTATAPGQAGQAGARIACLTLSAVRRQGPNPLG